MSIGIVLISSDGYYLGPDGQLPARHAWDKSFLTSLAKGQDILCSPNTANTLPPSIVKVASSIHIEPREPHTLNFGISSFTTEPKLFILVKAHEQLGGGKKFRRFFASYYNLLSNEDIEIWTRI